MGRPRWMGVLRGAALLFGITCAWLSAGAAQWSVVHAGRLLPIPGGPVLHEASVVVRDGRVERVAAGYLDAADLPVAPGDTLALHDLSGHFVMPGFIDGHVHLTMEFGPGYRLLLVEASDADIALRAAGYAQRTLMAGFTTVRDLGATGGDAIFALREGIRRGDVVGPRIYAAGDIITITGGHGDLVQAYREDVSAVLMGSGGCDGADACRRAVRRQVRRGADHIKLTATAGVLSESAAGLEQQFFDDELAAIIDTAHSMGRRVTAHAHGANGIKAALRAGVDAIEHGTFLDAEAVELFREQGAFLAPTLMPAFALLPMLDSPDSYLSPTQTVKARQALGMAKRYARQAYEGGVKIAFATDAGVFPHGQNAKEFRLLVEWGGLTPMEAIETATVNGAASLGRSDLLGTLEPGKYGDLVAVVGDPLKDVTELERVVFVMKEGTVYRQP